MSISSEARLNEVFYDSLEQFSGEERTAVMEGESCCGSGYEIWVNEPRSVGERRRNFLQEMGFLDEEIGSERLVDRDETASLLGLQESRDCDATDRFCEETNSIISNEESNELANESPLRVEIDECHMDQERRDLCEATRKATRSWWKRFVREKKTKRESNVVERPKEARVKVCQNKKKFSELTANYVAQEICAHKGLVWSMKFSPDGRYLASGGEDGVVRVWRVVTVEASSNHLTQDNLRHKLKEGKFGFQRKNPIHASVVIPDKLFRIDESPIHEFYGHSSDVLDLAWSTSNQILSSSMDKTVRVWQLGCNQSVNIFHHNDYVTCIEFNPVNDNYFISGSIDGKVRIWGLSEKRVVDWTDVRDVITAISFQPNGKGFIVGTITGTCRSYNTSGESMLLETKINISGRKKTARNRITGIKFSHDKPQRVMISSEDSKLRIFDGADLTHKYKGLAKSGSQTSPSFTSTERHIVSVGDDSRVYIWNYDPSSEFSSKQMKSVRSCEHFLCEGVSVAVPWQGMMMTRAQGGTDDSCCATLATLPLKHVGSTSWTLDQCDRFSLGSWFAIDGTCTKCSATWPEERLPLCDLSKDGQTRAPMVSETWGLVIVAAGLDGKIRTFQNYGLPIRL